MLIMDNNNSSSGSTQLPSRQVLMPSQRPFSNPSMLQMPLAPQYCLGPGAPFPPYGYVARGLPPFHGQPSTAGGSPPSAGHSSSASSTSSSCSAATAPNPSINRSQRCGVCRGCQCKPCGLCTYCQDSPQFGGPGVKKQSCIERRCLRVLENRLQRDAPSFKARVGCNNCDDCRAADCQICLVCLDKRFFNNKYMYGAMCAKKRCNNATSLELPHAQTANLDRNQQQQVLKRSYENAHFEHMIAKRRGLEMQMHQQIQQQTQDQLSTPVIQLAAPAATSSHHHLQPQAQLSRHGYNTPDASLSPSSNGASPAAAGKGVEEHQHVGNSTASDANTQFQAPSFNGSIAPQTTCFEPIVGVDNASSNVVPQCTSAPHRPKGHTDNQLHQSCQSRPSLVSGSIGQSGQVVVGNIPPSYNHLQPTPPAPFFSTTIAPMACTFEGGRQAVYQQTTHKPFPPLAIAGVQAPQEQPSVLQQQQHQFQTYHQYQQRFLNYPKYEYYEEDPQHGGAVHMYDASQPDLFVPPSYSELKNGVVLQPL